MPDMIAIGASMGGVEAVPAVLAGLAADLPAAIFVVQHTSPHSKSRLASIYNRTSRLRAADAGDGEAVEHGRVYVAPPDQHLLVREGRILLSHGPHENRSRPAIDPLFRSVAASYGPRAVGVVLTGLLDDGASGLAAMRRCGGVTVVQDPNDAAYPEMPRSALEATTVDHCVPLARMGELLTRLAHAAGGKAALVPPDIEREVAMANGELSDYSEELGELAPVTCTECGGNLWEIKTDGVRRYRCRTGHAYSARSLVAEQGEKIEAALWAAIRSMEERATMLNKLAGDSKAGGLSRVRERYQTRAREAREHADILRRILMDARESLAE
jgi:two-component system chemotaxis response regulator CheB